MVRAAAQSHDWTQQTILAALEAQSDALRRLGARRIGLFGSYRRGTQTVESDIDLLIVLEKPSFDSLMAIRLLLEDHFGRRVDLVLESGLKPHLRNGILGEVAYVEGL